MIGGLLKSFLNLKSNRHLRLWSWLFLFFLVATGCSPSLIRDFIGIGAKDGDQIRDGGFGDETSANFGSLVSFSPIPASNSQREVISIYNSTDQAFRLGTPVRGVLFAPKDTNVTEPKKFIIRDSNGRAYNFPPGSVQVEPFGTPYTTGAYRRMALTFLLPEPINPGERKLFLIDYNQSGSLNPAVVNSLSQSELIAWDPIGNRDPSIFANYTSFFQESRIRFSFVDVNYPSGERNHSGVVDLKNQSQCDYVSGGPLTFSIRCMERFESVVFTVYATFFRGQNYARISARLNFSNILSGSQGDPRWFYEVRDLRIESASASFKISHPRFYGLAPANQASSGFRKAYLSLSPRVHSFEEGQGWFFTGHIGSRSIDLLPRSLLDSLFVSSSVQRGVDGITTSMGGPWNKKQEVIHETERELRTILLSENSNNSLFHHNDETIDNCSGAGGRPTQSGYQSHFAANTTRLAMKAYDGSTESLSYLLHCVPKVEFQRSGLHLNETGSQRVDWDPNTENTAYFLNGRFHRESFWFPEWKGRASDGYQPIHSSEPLSSGKYQNNYHEREGSHWVILGIANTYEMTHDPHLRELIEIQLNKLRYHVLPMTHTTLRRLAPDRAVGRVIQTAATGSDLLGDDLEIRSETEQWIRGIWNDHLRTLVDQNLGNRFFTLYPGGGYTTGVNRNGGTPGEVSSAGFQLALLLRGLVVGDQVFDIPDMDVAIRELQRTLLEFGFHLFEDIPYRPPRSPSPGLTVDQAFEGILSHYTILYDNGNGPPDQRNSNGLYGWDWQIVNGEPEWPYTEAKQIINGTSGWIAYVIGLAERGHYPISLNSSEEQRLRDKARTAHSRLHTLINRVIDRNLTSPYFDALLFQPPEVVLDR